MLTYAVQITDTIGVIRYPSSARYVSTVNCDAATRAGRATCRAEIRFIANAWCVIVLTTNDVTHCAPRVRV